LANACEWLPPLPMLLLLLLLGANLTRLFDDSEKGGRLKDPELPTIKGPPISIYFH
jgi:hypothetical protein